MKPKSDLSPEADKFLAEATAEYNQKQATMQRDWKLDSHKQWGYDQSAGVLKLEYGEGVELHANGQILGSYDPAKGTWEWAWNNPNALPTVSRDSAKVRDAGEKYGIAYLKAGVVPVPDQKYVAYLCGIGLKATGSVGVYRGKAGPIEVFIMLKNPHWAKDMKWDDEPIAITVPEFVAGKSDIVLVIHDPGHGGWQFTDGQDLKGRKPKVIPKTELLRLDPSLAELKDLPVGWQARRASSKDAWIREKKPIGK